MTCSWKMFEWIEFFLVKVVTNKFDAHWKFQATQLYGVDFENCSYNPRYFLLLLDDILEKTSAGNPGYKLRIQDNDSSSTVEVGEFCYAQFIFFLVDCRSLSNTMKIWQTFQNTEVMQALKSNCCSFPLRMYIFPTLYSPAGFDLHRFFSNRYFYSVR